MRVDCIVTSFTEGKAELQLPFEEGIDCVRNFTCQDFETMKYFNVTCPGKMTRYTYKRVDIYNWECTAYSDNCVYTYSYVEKVTNIWKENGECGMPDGRSCCPPDSMLIA